MRRPAKEWFVGDLVLARPGDDWLPGRVSRKSGRRGGAVYDVRLDDGRLFTYLTRDKVKDKHQEGKVLS